MLLLSDDDKGEPLELLRLELEQEIAHEADRLIGMEGVQVEGNFGPLLLRQRSTVRDDCFADDAEADATASLLTANFPVRYVVD